MFWIPERSFILLFNKYFLNACCLPYTVQHAGFTVANRLDMSTTYLQFILTAKAKIYGIYQSKTSCSHNKET